MINIQCEYCGCLENTIEYTCIGYQKICSKCNKITSKALEAFWKDTMIKAHLTEDRKLSSMDGSVTTYRMKAGEPWPNELIHGATQAFNELLTDTHPNPSEATPHQPPPPQEAPDK